MQRTTTLTEKIKSAWHREYQNIYTALQACMSKFFIFIHPTYYLNVDVKYFFFIQMFHKEHLWSNMEEPCSSQIPVGSSNWPLFVRDRVSFYTRLESRKLPIVLWFWRYKSIVASRQCTYIVGKLITCCTRLNVAHISGEPPLICARLFVRYSEWMALL